MKFLFTSTVSFLTACGNIGFSIASLQPREKHPQIISHRGACGYVPEHSLNAYQLAIDLGTDYVEPDLCLSKEGSLVIMHDITLDDSTDVSSHPEFADRKKTQLVAGSNITGYFVADFTVAELKTLRLKQRLASRTSLYDNMLTIPTFDEAIELVITSYNKTGIMTGLYPELKKPSYHNDLGFELSMEEMFLNTLTQWGYDTKTSSNANVATMVYPILAQCFESNSLKTLRSLSSLPLMLLLNTVEQYNADILHDIAVYAQAVGPKKETFYGDLAEARDLIQLAHDENLAIHPWTFRQEESYVSHQFNNDPQIEAAYYYCCLKVDATFSEFPDQMRQILQEYQYHPEDLCASAGC